MATAAAELEPQRSQFTKDALAVWGEIRRLGLEYHVAELDAPGAHREGVADRVPVEVIAANPPRLATLMGLDIRSSDRPQDGRRRRTTQGAGSC